MPSYLHRIPAGTGLAVGPGHRRQPSMCGINTVTGLAPFLGMQIIGMAITSGKEGRGMPSLFPGMDPHLDEPSHWPSVYLLQVAEHTGTCPKEQPPVPFREV